MNNYGETRIHCAGLPDHYIEVERADLPSSAWIVIHEGVKSAVVKLNREAIQDLMISLEEVLDNG